MKTKSGPPKGSKNASKGGRDAHITVRVPSNIKEAVCEASERLKRLGLNYTPSDIINIGLRTHIKEAYPGIAEKHKI